MKPTTLISLLLSALAAPSLAAPLQPVQSDGNHLILCRNHDLGNPCDTFKLDGSGSCHPLNGVYTAAVLPTGVSWRCTFFHLGSVCVVSDPKDSKQFWSSNGIVVSSFGPGWDYNVGAYSCENDF